MMTPNSFAAMLYETIGLDTSIVGAATIERSVRYRMRRVGLQRMEEYWQRLQDSEEELQELIEDVVVPETWFFRHSESFAAFTRIVTRDWLPARAVRPLRILSLPCATGEEPYSIVITLLEAGLPPQRFTVDALDVSQKALSKAMRAQYRPISFRSGDLGPHERYFDRTATHYHVVEPVQQQVRFRYGNLLAPDLLAGEELYDFIFCRNVLIYFDRTTQERALQALNRLLTPDGTLFVGAGEAGLVAAAGGMLADSPASFAFRVCKSGPEPQWAKPLPRRPAEKTTALRRATPPIPAISAPPPPVLGAASLDPVLDLDSAARLADAGRLDEAAAACEACLRCNGPSAAAYFLLGLIYDVRGDAGKAVDCYRKAQYLEPGHSEALLHLALAQEKQGDISGARRLRARARRSGYPGD
jgi:chemotaxis protein methyltransferase WspC